LKKRFSAQHDFDADSISIPTEFQIDIMLSFGLTSDGNSIFASERFCTEHMSAGRCNSDAIEFLAVITFTVELRQSTVFHNCPIGKGEAADVTHALTRQTFSSSNNESPYRHPTLLRNTTANKLSRRNISDWTNEVLLQAAYHIPGAMGHGVTWGEGYAVGSRQLIANYPCLFPQIVVLARIVFWGSEPIAKHLLPISSASGAKHAHQSGWKRCRAFAINDRFRHDRPSLSRHYSHVAQVLPCAAMLQLHASKHEDRPSHYYL
jgi:hypothetical protein